MLGRQEVGKILSGLNLRNQRSKMLILSRDIVLGCVGVQYHGVTLI